MPNSDTKPETHGGEDSPLLSHSTAGAADEGGHVGRSGKDRAIIALLIVVIVALLCGVAYGANYLIRMYADNSAAVEEAASRTVPQTPDELKAASDESSSEGQPAQGAGSSEGAKSDESVQGEAASAEPVQPASDQADAAVQAEPAARAETEQPAEAQSDAESAAADQAGENQDVEAQPTDSQAATAQTDTTQTDTAAEAAQSYADASASGTGQSSANASAQSADATQSTSSASTAAKSASTGSASTTTAASDANLPDNPIDFKALQKENIDIYAWLYIPNTGINLPVLQNAFDDSYYLSHDAHREENLLGAVYSQIANKKDFSDPVTVLYGHDGEAQFKNLHYFEDEKFFQENDKMYIYTTGHIYTYRIISAYKSDNRHILNTYDFTKEDVLKGYFESILNPDSLLVNVREGVTLDPKKDKIVQMSTCMLDEFHGSSRYIVTGVLIDDQPTKQ